MNRLSSLLGVLLLSLTGLAQTAVPLAAAADCASASIRCVDDTAGSSQEYQTIQAAANAAVAGDTVVVFDGSYGGFVSVRSGTATSPIVFQANGAGVLVNTPGNSNGDNINIEGTNYVIVDGFRVANAGRTGIRVVNSRGVIVRNNVITNSGKWGILTGFAVEVQILNNQTSGSIGEHGIYVSNSNVAADNPVIRGNHSFGNSFNGIQINGDCFMGGDGIIQGAVLENNTIHDNGYKGFSLISIHDSVVQNNVIYNNGTRNGGAGGIHLADEPGCNDNSNNNVVVNNTLKEPRITGIRISQGSGNILFNNIAISSKPIIDELGGNIIDGTSNIAWTASTGLFVNEAAADFHLAPGSSAIDRGRASLSGKNAPAVDFDGNSRPQGALHDSGAYEFASSTPDATRPSVTINQAAAQADPTGTSPINFTAVFSEPVSGFTGSDVTLGGTSGATTATVTGGPTTFNIATSGMTGSGTVIATIATDRASDAAGNLNTASTSTDNTVTYNFSAPLVITTSSLPAGTVGTPYNAALAATGGSTPYTWSLAAGRLPRGLSLAPSTGVISGTPTKRETITLTVRVTDSNSATATKVLGIRINRP